jgi:hypothetical protein
MHFQVVKDRLLLLRAARQTEYLSRKVEVLSGDKSRVETEAQLQKLDAEIESELSDLDRDLEQLERANDPQVTFLPDAEYSSLQELLARLESQNYCDENGVLQPLISPEEKQALLIRKGSLTDSEFKQIQNHAQMSYDFLKQITWTRDLENLAYIAWGHHEKLTGGGYPRGVKGDEIPLPTRMMTIADIYDALTASDRPYKRAMPTERALQILQSEAEAGALDAGLLELFISRRVFEATQEERSLWLFHAETEKTGKAAWLSARFNRHLRPALIRLKRS